MNRRELFNALIYAPLIAPLAWMPEKKSALGAPIIPKNGGSGTIINNVSSKKTMSQEKINFVISADTSDGVVAVKRMTKELNKLTKAIKEMNIEVAMFDPEKLREKICQAQMEAAIKLDIHQA